MVALRDRVAAELVARPSGAAPAAAGVGRVGCGTRVVTCRYLRRSGAQCTAEAADEQVLLCTRHLGEVLVQLQQAGMLSGRNGR